MSVREMGAQVSSEEYNSANKPEKHSGNGDECLKAKQKPRIHENHAGSSSQNYQEPNISQEHSIENVGNCSVYERKQHMTQVCAKNTSATEMSNTENARPNSGGNPSENMGNLNIVTDDCAIEDNAKVRRRSDSLTESTNVSENSRMSSENKEKSTDVVVMLPKPKIINNLEENITISETIFLSGNKLSLEKLENEYEDFWTDILENETEQLENNKANSETKPGPECLEKSDENRNSFNEDSSQIDFWGTNGEENESKSENRENFEENDSKISDFWGSILENETDVLESVDDSSDLKNVQMEKSTKDNFSGMGLDDFWDETVEKYPHVLKEENCVKLDNSELGANEEIEDEPCSLDQDSNLGTELSQSEDLSSGKNIDELPDDDDEEETELSSDDENDANFELEENDFVNSENSDLRNLSSEKCTDDFENKSEQETDLPSEKNIEKSQELSLDLSESCAKSDTTHEIGNDGDLLGTKINDDINKIENLPSEIAWEGQNLNIEEKSDIQSLKMIENVNKDAKYIPHALFSTESDDFLLENAPGEKINQQLVDKIDDILENLGETEEMSISESLSCSTEDSDNSNSLNSNNNSSSDKILEDNGLKGVVKEENIENHQDNVDGDMKSVKIKPSMNITSNTCENMSDSDTSDSSCETLSNALDATDGKCEDDGSDDESGIWVKRQRRISHRSPGQFSFDEEPKKENLNGYLDMCNEQAEARLAARRQARAEAREIRMRELERQQREQEETADRQYDMLEVAQQVRTPSGRPAVSTRVERTPITNNIAYLSSRRSSEDSLEDAGTSLRDVRHELKELEEKFRKAMIANAQLDNEKSSQTYQLSLLKDRIEELEEELSQLRREHRDSCRENDQLKRAAVRMRDDLASVRYELDERERLIGEKGLVVVSCCEEGGAGGDRVTRALVSRESADMLENAGEGSLDVRLKRFAEEKRDLMDQLSHLRLELEEERSRKKRRTSTSVANASLQNGPSLEYDTLDVVDVQREANKQLADYKFRLQKSEQDVATLQATVARLESQVIRYKSSSEASEKAEDELKVEKRKLQREVKESQSRIEELETTNNHLQRRLDKVKNAKSALLKEL